MRGVSSEVRGVYTPIRGLYNILSTGTMTAQEVNYWELVIECIIYIRDPEVSRSF